MVVKQRSNKKSYLNRKDKHFFNRVSRKYGEEVQDFFVSNFLVNEKSMLSNLMIKILQIEKRKHNH